MPFAKMRIADLKLKNIRVIGEDFPAIKFSLLTDNAAEHSAMFL